MSKLRLTYLLLAVIGALAPNARLIGWLADNAWSPARLIAAWNANDAVAGLALDLGVAAIALSAFIVSECLVRRDRLALICVPLTYAVGVGFALPLYLFLRSRPMG